MRRLFRTLITLEVLSDSPAYEGWQWDIENVYNEITEGQMSGKVLTRESVEVSREEMKALLAAQGSDENFFELLDEEDDEVPAP